MFGYNSESFMMTSLHCPLISKHCQWRFIKIQYNNVHIFTLHVMMVKSTVVKFPLVLGHSARYAILLMEVAYLPVVSPKMSASIPLINRFC